MLGAEGAGIFERNLRARSGNRISSAARVSGHRRDSSGWLRLLRVAENCLAEVQVDLRGVRADQQELRGPLIGFSRRGRYAGNDACRRCIAVVAVIRDEEPELEPEPEGVV